MSLQGPLPSMESAQSSHRTSACSGQQDPSPLLTRWQAVTSGSEASPRIAVSTDEPRMTTAKEQTAFNRVLTPSAKLAAVIGATPQPHTEVGQRSVELNNKVAWKGQVSK